MLCIMQWLHDNSYAAQHILYQRLSECMGVGKATLNTLEPSFPGLDAPVNEDEPTTFLHIG